MKIVSESLKDKEIVFSFVPIGHQCSWEGIQRVCEQVNGMESCDLIVAVGGGKAVDLGKGVATVWHFCFFLYLDT